MHFADRFAFLLEREGLPRMAGRILAYLLVCEPLEQTSKDLREALGASKASISTMSRLLLQAGLIGEVPVPGGRGTAFVFEARRVERLFHDKIQQIHLLRETLESGLQLVEEQPAPLRSRMEEMVGLYQFLDREMPALLTRFRSDAALDPAGPGGLPPPHEQGLEGRGG